MMTCHSAWRGNAIAGASQWLSLPIFRSPARLRCFASISQQDDYFRYQSGRWLFNEEKRLRERYLKFDVSALIKAAANAVNCRETEVQSFRKLAEGGFNRVFEITMHDGFQVIARLPYPSTQPKALATASEVATMDLVRSHDVPTPLVYAYSTDPCSPVGAEYILMEKLSGRRLGDIWFDLSDKDRVKVLGEIVTQESKLFDIVFPASGSIYYSKDLPQEMSRIPLEENGKHFCVGPDVSLKYWFGTRSRLNIRRGPEITPRAMLEGAAKKEIAWLREHGEPRFPFDREYREMYGYQKVKPSDHIRNLEDFLAIVSSLVPSETWLHKPVIRHPDLNFNNLFVDDDLKITGIIDWQHTTVLPLFLHAGIPASIQNYGDPESEELKKPELPPDLDDMDEDDREKDLELYRRRHAHFYYVEATATKLGILYDAMAHNKGLLRKKIYQHAAAPWEGNTIPLRADIVQVSQNWLDIARNDSATSTEIAPCSIILSSADAKDTIKKFLEQDDIDRRMNILRDVLRISSDGWVSFDNYDHAVAQAAAMKETALGYAEDQFEREMTEKHWPFDDYDEDE